MFGSQWDKAEATIIARDAKFSGDGSVANYTYIADVRLSSGEVFRATISEPTIATDFWSPNVRDVVSVLVKAKDRKVKFDKDDKRLSVKAYEAAQKQAFADTLNQTPGTVPSGGTPTTAGTQQLPDSVAAQLAKLGIDPTAATQVYTANAAQAQAAMAAFTQAAQAAPAPSAAGAPEDRLAKLTDLRDRGLLSADEYAQQRQRILDEL